jgi:hypothetical protein
MPGTTRRKEALVAPLDRNRDPIQALHALGAIGAPSARRPAVASRAMRRSRRLALAMSVCALAAPAIAQAQTTTTTTPTTTSPATSAPKAIPSPFKADRLSSQPTGLSPNTAATPVRYPEQSVILTWGDVPKAVGYSVEVSDTPGFSRIVWKGKTTQAIAVPEILLPDGAYWWRVRAVDAAGTEGIWSDVARVAKVWPNQIAGTRLTATPNGPSASFTALNPYLFWNPVPGAQTYDVEVSPGDQFNSVVFWSKNMHQPFMTPAAAGALPDDTYSWRVRARDPKGNLGPWTVASTFTKAWSRPVQTGPADGATTQNLQLGWEPIDGAQRYEVQITRQEFNWSGEPLVISTSTAASSFTPTLNEQLSREMVYGPHWWRVRPVVSGVYGAWSTARRVNWQAPSPTYGSPDLTSTGDTTTGLSPTLMWRPVAGATLYRVDIAGDPQFNNLLEQEVVTSTSWTSRKPLPDNQIGSGYYWRVVWGNGSSPENLGLMVDEDVVPVAQFKKQTQVTLSAPENGGVVQDPPLLTWGAVPGIARYDVELSSDGTFADATTRKAVIYGLGAVPGAMQDEEKRLPDGTWSWRVRAVDGGDKGQTWSKVGTFTLNSARPTPKTPNDGASVVYSPLLQWTPVSGACGYEVQVARDPSFGSDGAGSEPLTTAQSAIVPPKQLITTPGVHYWRVRADYCAEILGQWSATRSFRSVFPPDFNLNSVPAKVEFGRRVVVGGQLKNNGAAVKKARLYLERRTYPSDTFKAAGIVNTNNSGRFRFQLKMNRSADYRLVWRESASNPEGAAAFGIDVQPRITFRLASGKVVRRKGLVVKGTVYPKRPGFVQIKTSDGWQNLRKVSARKNRFSAVVATGRLDSGKYKLRFYVPRDNQRRFVNTASKQRGVFIYDKFVIR